MRDSFVFYSSFLDTIERAPEQVRLSLFTELCNCGLERKKLSEVEYPVCLFVTQAMANVERSNKRYEQAVENGKQGGRPKKWIDQTGPRSCLTNWAVGMQLRKGLMFPLTRSIKLVLYGRNANAQKPQKPKSLKNSKKLKKLKGFRCAKTSKTSKTLIIIIMIMIIY